MHEEFHYSHIRSYKFSDWFKFMDYNGQVLSETERKKLVAFMDGTISQYISGFPIIQECLNNSKGQQDDFHITEYTLSSVMLFVLLTLVDSMVACKYFINANTDYDRRYMRGKLMVILNEGFKKLYGFEKKTRDKSEWSRLKPLMASFPELIQNQYKEMEILLETHSKSSLWWRDERNIETHLDAERLFLSRKEEIIESKVMMDSLKLINALLAVNELLTNVHACLVNSLVDKYYRGELDND